MTPTKATRTAAHVAVGVLVAALAVKTGKGPGGAVLGALLGAVAHEMLDAPIAQLMANAGLQFLGSADGRAESPVTRWPGFPLLAKAAPCRRLPSPCRVVALLPPLQSLGRGPRAPAWSGLGSEPGAQRLEAGVAEGVEVGRTEDRHGGFLVSGADLAERLSRGQGVIEGEQAGGSGH
jgi:hypothetical protein